MKDIFWNIWRWGRWPLLALVVGYAVLVGFRTKYSLDKDKSDAAVAKIHATKLTKEVLYSALPPEPDPAENNATLAGVDSNQNGIRDDVERAIYFKHQDSAKITAAEYQYAMALQKEFTHVFDSATLVAVIQEEGRAFSCMFDLTEGKDLVKINRQTSLYVDEVEELVFNTGKRTQFRESLREKYMTSYGLLDEQGCDLNF